MASHIVRFPRSDESDSFVVAQVSRGGAPQPLDVKIIATEGEESYSVELRQDHIQDLRDSRSACTDDEWEAIASALLLDKGELPDGVEAGAVVQRRRGITVTVRRRVQGLNQRLGTIIFKFKDEPIELFDWCGAAVHAKNQARADLAAATSKAQDLERKVAELRDQLEELAEVKKTEDADLIARFRALLNSKKAKAAELTRQLDAAQKDARGLAILKGEGSNVSVAMADADVSDEPVSMSKATRGRAGRGSRGTRGSTRGTRGARGARATASRASTAKAPATRASKRTAAQAVLSDDESDGGPAGASVKEEDETGDDEDGSDEHQNSDEDETASETASEQEDRFVDDDEPMDDVSSSPDRSARDKGKGKETTPPAAKTKQSHTLPSRAAASSVSAPVDDGDETASDDEL